MPVHDWSQLDIGDFHDFHNGWAIAIRQAINGGILPEGYEARSDNYINGVEPDFSVTEEPIDSPRSKVGGLVTLAAPKARQFAVTATEAYVRRQKRVVVRRADDRRPVAAIELVSWGNKAGAREFRRFLTKCVDHLLDGLHLLVIDLQKPSRRDPKGIHAAIWAELSDKAYKTIPGKNRTVVSYEAGEEVAAFINPLAVGDDLPDAALFLDPGFQVFVPLEETYRTALKGLPASVAKALKMQFRGG